MRLSLAVLQPFWRHFLHNLLFFFGFFFLAAWIPYNVFHPWEWALCAVPSGNTEHPQHLVSGRMQESGSAVGARWAPLPHQPFLHLSYNSLLPNDVCLISSVPNCFTQQENGLLG